MSPSSSPVFIPHDLIIEVLFFLPVKSVIRLMCMSKTFHSLVSDPTFVKLHLHRSARTRDVSLVSNSEGDSATLNVVSLSHNPSIRFTLPNDPYFQRNYKDCFYIVGSCNGLLCLGYKVNGNRKKMSLRFWNPATRKLSYQLRITGDARLYNLTFGYDSSRNTYKLVHFINRTTEVKVLNLGDNVWRNIPNSPICHHFAMHFVHMRDSVIWLAICNLRSPRPYKCKDITIEQFAAISLDLGTETHTRLSLPQGFVEVPFVMPYLSVLKDSLCFSHDFKQTHFVIWQMKEFGVEDSWTQFFKIRYHDLQIYNDLQFRCIPLCMSEKTDTLLLSNPDTAILYNLRNKKAESIDKPWKFRNHYYIESLVSCP
ncbi:F-box/kelch-repeat protein At3g06240-like [Vicia villosa]|uniref:F-box/kelch-repeat protein At3g06240-like n=1 Tax=Vicia villosa TaxID=3911 RepID=UPI00273B8440|nr:F-box/kelch-repeat protein At3g06240-like [Vicia villosa]XP_058761561.1 F-box/kelch-repeat protein At3g06240-like [Vicia villosa]